MITALVKFSLPQPVTIQQAKEIFAGKAPRYRDTDGLARKYYLLSEDGTVAGGVYLWKSRAHAEKLYTGEWGQFVKDKYGTEPSVEFFASPVIVDNLTGEILKDD